MISARHWLLAIALCLLQCTATKLVQADAHHSPEIRQTGWQLWQRISTGGAGSSPRFHQWHSANDIHDVNSGLAFPGGVRTGETNASGHLAGGPLMTFLHFNTSGLADMESVLDGSKPLQTLSEEQLPVLLMANGSQALLSAWWPVAQSTLTPMPVWNPDSPKRKTGSNGFINWSQIRAITASTPIADTGQTLSFAGRFVHQPVTHTLSQFHSIRLSAPQAQQLMTSARYRNAAALALGRRLRGGDHLALVAAHLLTGDDRYPYGVWSTYWWQPPSRKAADTPENLTVPWRNYHMDITVDPVLPREPDGSANICFNPWFDAVFADSGEGNGMQANCISCHLKASTPLQSPLRVTRGIPSLQRDRHTYYTGLLWSLANPANGLMNHSSNGSE